MELPTFTYFPDPLADGAIEASEVVCDCCGEPRGAICTGLLYADDVPDDALFCPWCVASGAAAVKYDGEFCTVEAGVPDAVREEVERRTPMFLTWQEWYWPQHCGDAMVYLGQPEPGGLPEEAATALRATGLADDVIAELGPDRSAVAYLFRCRACGALDARWDCD